MKDSVVPEGRIVKCPQRLSVVPLLESQNMALVSRKIWATLLRQKGIQLTWNGGILPIPDIPGLAFNRKFGFQKNGGHSQSITAYNPL